MSNIALPLSQTEPSFDLEETQSLSYCQPCSQYKEEVPSSQALHESQTESMITFYQQQSESQVQNKVPMYKEGSKPSSDRKNMRERKGYYKDKTKHSDLYSLLNQIIKSYSTEEKIKEIKHPHSTQKNEAMNTSVLQVAPKNKNISRSTRLHTNIGTKVCTTSVGYEEFSRRLFIECDLDTKQYEQTMKHMRKKDVERMNHNDQQRDIGQIGRRAKRKMTERSVERRKEIADYQKGAYYKSERDAFLKPSSRSENMKEDQKSVTVSSTNSTKRCLDSVSVGKEGEAVKKKCRRKKRAGRPKKSKETAECGCPLKRYGCLGNHNSPYNQECLFNYEYNFIRQNEKRPGENRISKSINTKMRTIERVKKNYREIEKILPPIKVRQGFCILQQYGCSLLPGEGISTHESPACSECRYSDLYKVCGQDVNLTIQAAKKEFRQDLKKITEGIILKGDNSRWDDVLIARVGAYRNSSTKKATNWKNTDIKYEYKDQKRYMEKTSKNQEVDTKKISTEGIEIDSKKTEVASNIPENISRNNSVCKNSDITNMIKRLKKNHKTNIEEYVTESGDTDYVKMLDELPDSSI